MSVFLTIRCFNVAMFSNSLRCNICTMFSIFNDAIFLAMFKKQKTSLKRCTLMMFLRRTVKWLKIFFYWNIKFACLTKEFLKTSLKNSALFATQCNFHPTHVHMEPIIGSPSLYLCPSVNLFETLWRPSEACQCCQCCEDLASEDLMKA